MLQLFFFTLQIPSYFTEEQIEDFQKGISTVKKDNQFLFIRDRDAIAIDYGYAKNLNHEFDEKDVTVIFVGVSFAVAECYAVTYSKVRKPSLLTFHNLIHRTNTRFSAMSTQRR